MRGNLHRFNPVPRVCQSSASDWKSAPAPYLDTGVSLGVGGGALSYLQGDYTALPSSPGSVGLQPAPAACSPDHVSVRPHSVARTQSSLPGQASMRFVGGDELVAFQRGGHDQAVGRVAVQVGQQSGAGGYETVHGDFVHALLEQISPPDIQIEA